MSCLRRIPVRQLFAIKNLDYFHYHFAYLLHFLNITSYSFHAIFFFRLLVDRVCSTYCLVYELTFYTHLCGVISKYHISNFRNIINFNLRLHFFSHLFFAWLKFFRIFRQNVAAKDGDTRVFLLTAFQGW